MSKVKTKMQRGVVVLLLGSALLLLAGCGGGNSESTGDGGEEGNAPAAQPTKRALPTMPSARFAAPTTMITPESARSEVSTTVTLTATEEMSESEEVTATEEMTDTE